jgi:DNA-binding response OmpR family regulator
MLPNQASALPWVPVPHILVVSDATTVRADVRAALPDADITVQELTRGGEVRAAVAKRKPDLVVLDEQIGKMGAMAVCKDLVLESGSGRLPRVPVLILLDRRADVFLARHAEADGWVMKPVDPLRLSTAMARLLAGERYEDDSQTPVTVSVPEPTRGGVG